MTHVSHEPFVLASERAALLRAQGPRGRYAPSPTGPLHLGNLRTALLAWLHARLSGAVFVLRIEDLDEQRARDTWSALICADLRWLGLDWDEGPDTAHSPCGPYSQSERSGLYEAALSILSERGGVYPCICTRRDIREAAGAPRPGEEVRYAGTCRGLSAQELLARLTKAGRADAEPAWRYAPPEGVFAHEDGVLAHISQDVACEVGDFVVKRKDGLFAYQLAVVVDDALMGITDVVRGADLASSTPRQLALYEALGFEAPRFWHVPLMCGEDGEKLSKRDGASSLEELRARGVTAAQVVGELAAGLGWASPGDALSAGELLAEVGTLTRWREGVAGAS